MIHNQFDVDEKVKTLRKAITTKNKHQIFRKMTSNQQYESNFIFDVRFNIIILFQEKQDRNLALFVCMSALILLIMNLIDSL